MNVKDIFALRKQGRIEEDSAARFMHYAEGRLIKESEKFRKRYFAIHRPKRKQEAPNGLNNSLNSSDSCSQKKDHESTESTESSCHSSDSCSLNKGQQAVYACIQQNPGYNVPKISADTGIPSKSIERHIKALLERDLITHQGSKKTGGYYAK